MGGPATVPQKMTLEEFYAWADRQEEPYEFVDGVPVPLYPEADESGVVRAMAGGTWDHHTAISKGYSRSWGMSWEAAYPR